MTPVYEGNPRNIDQMQGSGMFDGMSYFETPTSQMRNMADFSSNFQFRKSPLMQSPGPNYRFSRYAINTPQTFFDGRSGQWQNKDNFPQSPLLNYLPSRGENIQQMGQNESQTMFTKKNK